MPTPPTEEELFNAGRAEAILRRNDLTVQEGHISEMYLWMAVAMASRVTGYATQKFLETYLDGATEQALTDLASDHWNIDRIVAATAKGQVSFVRPTSGAGAGTIPAGSEVATIINADGTDFRFTTDVDLTFGGSELGPKAVNVTAVEAGPDSNVAPGEVTRIISTLFDSTLTTTASTQMAGGANEESDDELRERVRDFVNAVSKGTLAALEFGAKQVAGVKNATASEDLITGDVTVFVSDVNGNSTAQMLQDVDDELLNWRAAGVKVIVTGGVPVLQDVTYSISVRPGVDVAALESDITLAIQGTINKLKIGETLFRVSLTTAIQNVDTDRITNVTLTIPAADITPTSIQLLRPGVITRI